MALDRLMDLVKLRGSARDLAGAPRLDADMNSRVNAAADEIRSLIDAGSLAEALKRAGSYSTQFGDHHEWVRVRALVLVAWKRYREAAAQLYVADASGDAPWEILHDAGWCYYIMGNMPAAIALHERACLLDPQNPRAQFGRAVALLGSGAMDEALAAFREVARIDPDHADCRLNIATCLHQSGVNDEAEPLARDLVRIDPNHPGAWSLLGSILAYRGDESGSLACFHRAHEIEVETDRRVGCVPPYAAALMQFGRVDEAVELCMQEVLTNPDPAVHSALAFALLTVGDFAEGWRQYEYRWFHGPLKPSRAQLARPHWSGQDLSGRTILLQTEQGFGDLIQFLRFAKPLKDRGARVLLQISKPFGEDLARSCPFVDSVCIDAPATADYDYYARVAGLPRVLGEEMFRFAEFPYLHATEASRNQWRSRLPDGPKVRVGVAWAGNPKHLMDRRRSIPAALLADLWQSEGIQFVVLQKEMRPGDADALPDEATVPRIGPLLADFSDTAAVISELDLVICVDTAIAHLAGAMGKPIWLLLPKASDFRWQMETDRTFWYPSMRIFRQGTAGDWREVISRVRAALAAFADEPERPPVPSPTTRVMRSNSPPIAQVTETTCGYLQYLPGRNDCATAVERYGEYLRPQLEALTSLLPENAQVIDVGADIGFQALWWARRLGVDAHVMCYEGDWFAEQLLRNNIASNEMQGRITVPRGALRGLHRESMELGRGVRSNPPLHGIDDLMVARLDLLKIDCAYDVTAVIHGAENTIWRLRPCIYVTCTDPADLPALAVTVEALGYRCWRHDLPLYDLGNFLQDPTDVFSGRIVSSILCMPEEAGRDPFHIPGIGAIDPQ